LINSTKKEVKTIHQIFIKTLNEININKFQTYLLILLFK